MRKKCFIQNCRISINVSNGDTYLIWSASMEELSKSIKFKILNKNLHFLFNIFVTDIEMFSKYYNGF